MEKLKKTILITGSSGFIGEHLIQESLKKDWNIIAVDKIDNENKILDKNIDYIKSDIRDIDYSKLKKIDYIAHLAFVTNIPFSIQNPLSTTFDNIDMTAFLLKKSNEIGLEKFVFPSTASLYGNNLIPWNEKMMADPIEPYSWQKLSCEYLCKMWSTRYNLKTSTLRLFQVFGENQRKDTALAAFIRAKKKNEPITLTETTAQSAFKTGRRDFIYVKDVAKAFLACMTSTKTGRGEIINVGSGKMNTMEEIANAIGGEIKFIPKRNFEVEAHQADMKNCFDLLDWKPSIEILDWLKKHMEV